MDRRRFADAACGETEGDDDTGPEMPTRRNPFEDGLNRRRFVRSSAAVGSTTVLAGCFGAEEGSGGDGEPTVYVFNNGDRTVTVIDAERDEAVATHHIDTTASFPANQYGTSAESGYDVLWLNVTGGVRALEARSLEDVAAVGTGAGPNYPNLTPDEQHLIVAAGGSTSIDPEPDPDEPETHGVFRIDADRESETFGEVTGRIETGYTGPCDVSLEPSGEYAYVPEIADETLRVVRTEPFETVAEIDVGDPVGDGQVLPFMCTASFAGDVLLVENGEGTLGSDPEVPREGSESIWDVSTPDEPKEVARITRADGLPAMPITSEIAPDGEAGYLFTPDAGSVTVIDLEERAVDRELDVGGEAISGAWGPFREKLYVPVQTANQVAVVDHERREVVATIEAGEAPTGAVGGTVRPEVTPQSRLRASLAALGLEFGRREATYCPESNCYCG
ncbi:hypothetical protein CHINAEXTREME_08725 [Halobiforma lacisalsi AJ5]|uniref:40-residue YVTN family beta-propeller repeat-containing protein n=1 Tax=Natronobacterium lacisalsi AJ5 TaxID=358396 RepID=M0L6G2_NATLA|nr:hypothetical protein [Halobiforma lacisalsi]APW97858.1 hypothetical protein CHINAEXTREME_08725 [Halobiforma lacisalsi AJ5]EMA29126.1 hypothetical protein C445_17299 [Halobiforma lacisalsi AJ5]